MFNKNYMDRKRICEILIKIHQIIGCGRPLPSGDEMNSLIDEVEKNLAREKNRDKSEDYLRVTFKYDDSN